jgi:glycosyltransferase involved in cell wall biosynthesis
MPIQAEKLAIVIPAFNESEVIGDVVVGCRGHFRQVMVVVVDDCSEDDTAGCARRAGGVVVRHPVNLGQGAALQTGLRYALDHGAETIVTFDADGQHRVSDLDVLIGTQQTTGADVVQGSRFLGSAEAIPLLRRLVLRIAVAFTRVTSGTQVTDAHNGLRLLTRRAAQQIRIRQNRMAHASELVEQFRVLKLKVVEAPVTIVYTEYSLRKGQRLSNAFNILADLLVAKLK